MHRFYLLPWQSTMIRPDPILLIPRLGRGVLDIVTERCYCPSLLSSPFPLSLKTNRQIISYTPQSVFFSPSPLVLLLVVLQSLLHIRIPSLARSHTHTLSLSLCALKATTVLSYIYISPSTRRNCKRGATAVACSNNITVGNPWWLLLLRSLSSLLFRDP